MFREPPPPGYAIVLIREGEPDEVLRDRLNASDLPMAFAAVDIPEGAELGITRRGRRIQMDFNYDDPRIWQSSY